MISFICGLVLFAQASSAQPALYIDVEPEVDNILLDEPEDLTLIAKAPQDVSYLWTIEGPGKLEGEVTGPAVIYVPPAQIDEPTTEVTISVTVTDDSGQTASKSVTLILIGAAPPPTPTPTPTPSPTPTPEPRVSPFEREWVHIPAATYSFSEYIKPYLAYLKRNEVVITQAFSIQAGEVTVGAFRQYVNSLDAASREQLGTRWEQALDGTPYDEAQPVENVSWQEASAYADWVAQQTGWEVRLPTTLEWAAACAQYPEHPIVLEAENNQPSTRLQGEVDHLLGNLREWSSDACGNGTYRLLGENYMTDFSSPDVIGQSHCVGADERWSGVGFRLVRREP